MGGLTRDEVRTVNDKVPFLETFQELADYLDQKVRLEQRKIY